MNLDFLFLFVYLLEREGQRQSSYLLLHSFSNFYCQSWEHIPGLPQGWQELSYLNLYRFLPGPSLAGSWSQELEPAIKPRHFNVGVGHLNQQAKCQLLYLLSLSALENIIICRLGKCIICCHGNHLYNSSGLQIILHKNVLKVMIDYYRQICRILYISTYSLL